VNGEKVQGAVGHGGARSKEAAPPTFLLTARAAELKEGLRLDIGKIVAELLWELEIGG